MLITADFETYYSPTYSLSKISTEEYIRSPQFEVIGVSIKIDDGPTQWYPQPQVEAALRAIDWSRAFLVAQNAIFEGAILAWRYDIRPKGLLDTMGMSRALFPHEKSHSLASQAKRAGIGAKGEEVVHAIGKRYADFDAEALARYGAYCCNDVELTYELFKQYMAMGFPEQELKLIDLTLRMYTEPVLRLDGPLLVEHLQDVKARKAELLATLRDHLIESGDADAVSTIFTEGTEGLKKHLMSNEKFAAMLRSVGVEPPTKISATTGKEAYAFAKSDEEFVALAEHPDERVQALVAARLGNKSTLEETRTERFIEMAARGPFAVPLRYYGAHSGRWSGQDGVNLQNLPARDPKGKALKNSILPPEGHVFIDCDSAQIECVSGDTKVLTRDRGYVEIVDILTSDLLWDGVEWVSHTGVVFKGYREVITYAGITGTPDHVVYTSDGRRLQLAVAAREGAALAVGERGGEAVRFVGGAARPDPARWGAACVGAVRALPAVLSRARARFTQRKVNAVQARRSIAPLLLDPTSGSVAYASGAVQPHYVVYQPGLYQPSLSSVPGAGDAESVHVVRGVRTVRVGEPPAPDVSGGGDRSYRQHRALRSGEPALRDARAERAEPAVQYLGGVSRRADERPEVSPRGRASLPRDYRPSVAGHPEGVGSRRVVPVFDITNAGPRHRFTANGVIISNCRTLAWLAGQDDLVEAFRAKADVYKRMASAIYGKPQEEISKVERQVGKVVVLGCGYGIGHKKMRLFLKMQAGVEVSEAEAKRIVDTYRAANHRIVELWRRSDAALGHLASGVAAPVDVPGVVRVEPGKGLTLPNRLHIQYPNLRRVYAEDGKAAWVYDSKGEPTYVYGGKAVENCIAGGTDVLTSRGWVPIENVRGTDLVYDGEEFVSHGGTVFKSVQACVTIDGVYMTPDHEVLTDAGWQAASQSPRPFRPDLRGGDRAACGVQQREEAELAVSLPVRGAVREGGRGCDQGGQARRNPQLRVLDPVAYIRRESTARHVEAPGVRGVAQHARSLQATVASGVAKLRRAWDHGVRSLAGVFREFLGGYGAYIPAWAGLGPQGQRWPVQPGELRVDHAPRQHHEQAQYRAPGRRNNAEQADWYKSYNTVLPAGARMASRATDASTVAEKPVYDILNAGPRHRFVVRGDTGPFIVHNCTQAVARCVVAEQMLRVARRYKVVLTVHDSVGCVAPVEEAEQAQAYVEECMRWVPAWANGLPLSCESGVGASYGAC